MKIELNFINRSHDQNNSCIFLFQKNAAMQLDQLPTAWKVIQHCGYNCNHPLAYSEDLEVSINDYRGNHSPRRPVRSGELFTVTPQPMGRSFARAGNHSNSREFAVRNDLALGAVNVSVFNNGRLLAVKTNVAPGQKALFEFTPTLWIGAASQVVEGEALSSAIVSAACTELPLRGIARADIVMTGGGVGSDCAPLHFSLENIAMA